MLADSISGTARVRGRARLATVTHSEDVRCSTNLIEFAKDGSGRILNSLSIPGYWTFSYKLKDNIILYDWATIIAQLLRKAPDGRQYGLSAMYIEFENNSGSEVSPPSPARDESLSYYTNGLGVDRDYLRIPLIGSLMDSTDSDLFPQGNRLRLFGQTSGVTGVGGLPFSAGAQSRVYGGALVATPDFSDAAQDIVFSRRYYDPDDQLIKAASSQIGQEWELIFD